MSRYSFLFTARWLKYIAMTIIVVIACVCLALWQKDRREQRENEIATINANLWKPHLLRKVWDYHHAKLDR